MKAAIKEVVYKNANTIKKKKKAYAVFLMFDFINKRKPV